MPAMAEHIRQNRSNSILSHRPRYSVPSAEDRKRMPILRLPEEVLAQIFKQCQTSERRRASQGETPSDASWPSPPVHMEVVLSHVCSWLRYVVLSAPILWSHLSITPKKQIDEIGAYLSRSATCVLDVSVNSLGDDDDEVSTSLTENFELLLPHVKRCRTLRIKLVREYSDHPIVWRLKDLEAPQLENLFISVSDVDFVDTSDGLESILSGGTSQLTTVGLRGFSTILFRPPLESVTNLHFEQNLSVPMSYYRFSQILSMPLALTHLSVYGDVVENTHPWPVRGIDLPYLRSLRICGISGTIYSSVLVAIVAPDLETLVFKDLHERDLDHFWFSPGEMQKFTNVKHLTFQDVELTRTVHRKVLAAFPGVVTFTTTRSADISSLLLRSVLNPTNGEDSAVEGENRGVLWPNLNTLVLVDDIFAHQDDLVTFVKTRKEVGHPITTLQLSPESLLGSHEGDLLAEDIILENFNEDTWMPNLEVLYGEDAL